MTKKRKKILKGILIISLILLAIVPLYRLGNFNIFALFYKVGDKIDSFNGVNVYYNGKVGNVTGRNLSEDGYNIGKKYQCVEFVKRYYYEYYNHKMPDSYGHAKDFFDTKLNDGQLNIQRNLIQYENPSKVAPKVGDILVYKGTFGNSYGHVSIVAETRNGEIEIIQQNPGAFKKTRHTFKVEKQNDKWAIKNNRILGWLRKE